MIKNAFSNSVKFLWAYSSLLGIMHGIFQVLQGPVRPPAVIIQAIGSPCQPEMVWHACFPAITVLPNMLISGMLAIILSVAILMGSLVQNNIQTKSWLYNLLFVSLLLVGGGFVPVFIGVITGLAVILSNNRTSQNNAFGRLIAKLWPWPLLMMALWLPGSWLLGHYFSEAMLSFSVILFVYFDLGLPVLGLLSAYGFDATRQGVD